MPVSRRTARQSRVAKLYFAAVDECLIGLDGILQLRDLRLSVLSLDSHARYTSLAQVSGWAYSRNS